MPRSVRRRALLALVLSAVALGGLLAATPVGKLAYFGSRAWLADRSHFEACTPDPRLLCEQGAEAAAVAIAPLLPAAHARIEDAFGMSFSGPVQVYVYASPDSFAHFSGVSPRAAGAVSLGVVHLAPRLAAATGHESGIIAHELAHLHLIQRVGTAGIGRLPNWLWKGLPTYLSGGGGAGNATPDNAAYALAHGKRFEAETDGSLLFPKSAQAYGLDHGMYYRQAALLLEWMDRKDPPAFRRMLAALGQGKGLPEALAESYGQPMDALWREFLSTLSGSA